MVTSQYASHNVDAHFSAGLADNLPDPFTHRAVHFPQCMLITLPIRPEPLASEGERY